jgi:hypothetical protein
MECRFKEKKCFRCGEKGHMAYHCQQEKNKTENNKSNSREDPISKEGERVLFGDMENEETDWETIYGIIDTGCKTTIVGSI